MENVVISLLDQFERGQISRRQLVQSLTLGMVAASGSAPLLAAAGRSSAFKAVAVNHISYQVPDYARIRDFYADLLGMRVSEDNGQQCALSFGPTFMIPRTPRTPLPDNQPRVDHLCYTIENWDRKAVEDELKRRGLDPKPDRDTSFHIRDPAGFDVQIASREMKAAGLNQKQ
jgi:catechol 2,3-dioxygenase-like lactoylglutathione lyase family enzyme